MKRFLLLLLPVVMLACAEPDNNNLEEKRNRELEVDNGNVARKARELEADLEKKQSLFSAVKGTFEGIFTANNKEFKARVNLLPSLPPYQAGRTRTLDEITADLSNLYFTVQVTLLNAQTNGVISGCIFSMVRPDYDGGQINASSEGCSNIFFVSLYSSLGTGTDLPFEKIGVPNKSKRLARDVFEKRLPSVDELFVEMTPTMSQKSFLMVLKRKGEE